MKKNSIALMIVPIFALTACDDTTNYESVATPQNEAIVKNEEGFYSTVVLDSYQKAQADGYTGTVDDWIKLVSLYETNPQQAQAEASESGFSGGEMLLGALAGAAIGGLLANSMSSKNNMASNTYSAQRTNNAVNYAQTQQYNDDCKTSNDKICRNSGGTAARSSSTNTAALAATSANRNSYTRSAVSTSAPKPAVSAPAPTVRATSVSRGGFGGSFSGGGG